MRWPYIISMLALLGAGLLLFFNILCGASTGSVLGRWYWLEAGTENIPGAHPVTRWTNYDSCGVRNGRNADCSSKSAAYPMSPAKNFGTTDGVPPKLHSRHGRTFYLSKTGWAFLLIGLFFTICAILPVAVSFCMPSLAWLTVFTSISTNTALFFTTLSATLLTSGYVIARNAFRSDGQHTKLGKTMIAFVWTSVFLLFISSLLSGVGCLGSLRDRRNKKRYPEHYDSSSHETYGNTYMNEKEQKKRSRGGFFSRNKNAPADVENFNDETYTRGAAGTGTGAGAGAGVAGAGVAGAGVAAAGVNRTYDAPTESRYANGNEATYNSNKAQDLEAVGYAAGVGASGATSKYATGNTASKGTGRDLEDVGYAAGVGASGATSKYATGSGQAKGTGVEDSTYSTSRSANPQTKSYDNKGRDLENVGYAAGLGASGATSKYATGNAPTKGTGVEDSTYSTSRSANPQTKSYDNKGRDLENVGYAAGLGASGATSKYTTGNTASKGTGRDLEDVGYAAGVGASGATSKYTTGSGQAKSSGVEDTTYSTTHPPKPKTDIYDTSNKDRDLESVGYAAGLGASGATSKYTTGSGQTKSSGVEDTTYSTTHPPKPKTNVYDTSNQGKDLEDVAYAAGYGASGATSNVTKDSKSQDKSSAPYDNTKATGLSATDSDYAKTDRSQGGDYSGKDYSYGDRDLETTDKKPKGLWAAVSALGFGGVATGTSDDSHDVKDTTHDEADRANLPGDDATDRSYQEIGSHKAGSDTGPGATRASKNSENLGKSKVEYETKSTALPVGGGKWTEHGIETGGNRTGVPVNSAAIAAETAEKKFVSGGYVQNVTQKPASSVEDTYKNIDTSDRKDKDLTDTYGYEPTAYYSKTSNNEFTTDESRSKFSEPVYNKSGVVSTNNGTATGSRTTKDEALYKYGRSAGFGSSGAPSGTTRDTSHGLDTEDRDANMVAKSAGLGATGAVPGTTNKHQTHGTSTGGTSTSRNEHLTKSEERDLEKVAEAAGFGASGATSDYTKGQYSSAKGSSAGKFPTATGATSSDKHFSAKDSSLKSGDANQKLSNKNINIDVSKNRNPITGKKGEYVLETGAKGGSSHTKPSKISGATPYDDNLPGSFNAGTSPTEAVHRGNMRSDEAYTYTTGKDAYPRSTGLAETAENHETKPESEKGLLEVIVDKTKNMI